MIYFIFCIIYLYFNLSHESHNLGAYGCDYQEF